MEWMNDMRSFSLKSILTVLLYSHLALTILYQAARPLSSQKAWIHKHCSDKVYQKGKKYTHVEKRELTHLLIIIKD